MKLRVVTVALALVASSAWSEMVLVVETPEEPPTIDLAEILDDAKDTRRRLGWMAALRVGVAAGMYHLQSESIKSQCQGSLCGAMGMGLVEGMQLGMLEGQVLDDMTEVFEATLAGFDQAGTDGQAADLAHLVGVQTGGGALNEQLATLARRFITLTTEIAMVNPTAETNQVPTHALRLGVQSVGTDGNFINAGLAIAVTGQAELVELATGEVIDEHQYVIETPERTVVDWSAGGAATVAQDVVFAMAQLTEVLSEEVLMVVTSPSGKGKGYLMKPIDPASKVCLVGRCRGKLWGNYGFKSEVASHEPTLTWQPFEERYLEDPLYPEAPDDIDGLLYDVRLFEAVQISSVMGDAIYGAGPLVDEIRGIDGPSYTLDKRLPACRRIMWTVRARFVAGDKRHLTRWSGHYKERTIAKWHKGETGWDKVNDVGGGAFFGVNYESQRQESAHYFAFRTPPEEGQKKCKW